jgi:hypothetical protein
MMRNPIGWRFVVVGATPPCRQGMATQPVPQRRIPLASNLIVAEQGERAREVSMATDMACVTEAVNHTSASALSVPAWEGAAARGLMPEPTARPGRERPTAEW